jgi:hypothetical protein
MRAPQRKAFAGVVGAGPCAHKEASGSRPATGLRWSRLTGVQRRVTCFCFVAQRAVSIRMPLFAQRSSDAVVVAIGVIRQRHVGRAGKRRPSPLEAGAAGSNSDG